VTETLAIRAAGNLACRRPFRPPFPIRDELRRLRCGTPAKHEKTPANSGGDLGDGGLKGLLQARLPARQSGRMHATNGQTPVASDARLDKLKNVVPNKSAETSLGAADTSVRATSRAASGACVRRAGLARAEKSLGAGRQECLRHVGSQRS